MNQGLIDLDTLETRTDLSTLSNVAELITAVNNFTPEGESFQKALGKYDFTMGEILQQLNIYDADGDTISVTIVDENDVLDVDGDQLGAFGINSSYQLVVLDVSDATFLLSENDSLMITFY